MVGAPCHGRAPRSSPAVGPAPSWEALARAPRAWSPLGSIALQKAGEVNPHWCVREGSGGVEQGFLAAKEGIGVSREMASSV